MHDPLTVAFEIRRPWPQRSRDPKDGTRWQVGLSPFWVLAGRGWYFPAVVIVWHREPGGHDSGRMCPQYRRWPDEAGMWHGKPRHWWRWHIWHWKIQVLPLQALRRQVLTRCAWCGGRSRSGDPVNISHSWDGPRGRWWRGEPGLFHHDCSSVQAAHAKCLCDVPKLPDDYGSGRCLTCGKFRPYRSVPDDADRMLAALHVGSRIPAALRPTLEAAWQRRRTGTQP